MGTAVHVATTTRPGAGLLADVRRFLDEQGRRLGHRVLSDHHWTALTSAVQGDATPIGSAIGAGGDQTSPLLAAITAHDGHGLVGYAQVVAGNAARSVEVAVAPGADRRGVETALLDAARAAHGDAGEPLQWWVHEPGADERAVAEAAGFRADRHLLQLRRRLPTGLDAGVATRPFRPDEDEAAWLEVNNRAFAGHPEQGAWTLAALRLRMAEPWFDPAGFRLHERDGRLAAFCWTKLHRNEDPVLGEIYVIGVDPDFQGLGLGRALTLAGLASISDRGVGTGMLYVDAANTAAVGLYESLGFRPHHVDVAYTAPRDRRAP